MKETDMQTMFRKHINQHPPKECEVYELKICKGNCLPFDALKDHQIASLLASQSEIGFFHKITDPPIFYGGKMRFNVPRPFDCLYLTNVKAFVIVWFYRAREKKIFIKIPIKEFIHEKEVSLRKSLTEQRALEIGQPFLLNIHE